MLLRSLLLLLMIFLVGCYSSEKREYDLLHYVPEDATVLVRINNLNTFQSDLKNNRFLEQASGNAGLEQIKATFSFLKGIQSDSTSLLALIERDSIEVLWVSNEQPQWLTKSDSISVLDTIRNTQHSIKLEGITLYTHLTRGKRIISTSEEVLRQSVKPVSGRRVPAELEMLYKTVSPNKAASFFVNTRVPSKLFPTPSTQSDSGPGSFLKDWVSLEMESGQRYLRLNGLVRVKDTSNNYLRLFEGSRPVQNTTPTIASTRADAVLSYSFDDFETFAANQRTYLDTPYSINSDLDTVEELGIILENGEKAVVLRTYAPEGIQSFLDDLSKDRREYQGYEIIGLTQGDYLVETFRPLIQDFQAKYYVIIDDKFAFAEKRSLLENMISSYNSGSVFSESPLYQSAIESLADESNILFVSNEEGLHISTSIFHPEDFIKDIFNAAPEEYVFSKQVVADDQFFHTHLAVNRLQTDKKAGTTSPLFTVELDEEIATDPQFVLNHRTNNKEIVVQDTDNYLYLISTDGKVLWKKQLEGRIQGRIHQIDIYKNGRLQLAFTTSNQLLVLDRNGKEGAALCKTYPGGNLNPLAVFDYENNKNYRLVVTQGAKVFMYNSRGNIVSGFTYTDASSPVIKPPKHIRIGQRDYLVFQLENGTLKILNRVGADRITVSETIEFSENDVYLHRNKFILTDKSGMLISIDPQGKLSKSKLNMNEDHGLDATVKTLVTLNENNLTIKGRSRDMELGVYLQPQIFYIYDKIYVATTDIQSGQVYLFDSNNRSISNFPVFGNSTIDMADIDRDSRLEIVTKDQDNSLIVYSIR